MRPNSPDKLNTPSRLWPHALKQVRSEAKHERGAAPTRDEHDLVKLHRV